MTDTDTLWPPGTSPDRFASNLEAIASIRPELAERLCAPIEGDHVVGAERVFYRLRGTDIPLDVEPEDAQRLVERAARDAGDRPLLVLGVGCGELVDRALERGTQVVAWDRDPWLLRLLLGRTDYARELRAGRLRIGLGADLVELAPHDHRRVVHPFLGDVYANEIAFVERGSAPKRALVCAGGLYVDSLARALGARGYAVWTLDSERLSHEELDHTARTLEPGLVASINYRDGLAEFAHGIGAPLIVWEIDPSTTAPRPPTTPTEHARVFTYRRESAREFRTAGFEHVEYLPLAADTELRRPLELDDGERTRYAARVSFVGSSLSASAAELAELFRAGLARHGAGDVLEDVLSAQRADFSRWLVPELLEEHAPGFRDRCNASGEAHDPAVLAGEIAASEKRLSYAANLGRFGLQVWGDPGWERVAAHGVRYRGPASHAHDLTRIYCASEVNLDVGRLYQSDIATMRVYDILACGGFALVEHSPALEEVFEVGVEVESYRDLDELTRKLEHYLAHPASARAVAARGWAAVRERHTFELRVAHMLASLATHAPPGMARAG